MFQVSLRLVFVHLTCERTKSHRQDTSILLCKVSILELVARGKYISSDFLGINKNESVVDAEIIAHSLKNVSAIPTSQYDICGGINVGQLKCLQDIRGLFTDMVFHHSAPWDMLSILSVTKLKFPLFPSAVNQ